VDDVETETIPVIPPVSTPVTTPVSIPNDIATVTAVIVNFNTQTLLKRAYKSFRGFYPGVPIIIVDNGSNDASAILVKELAGKPNVSTILFDHNVGHGPAMDKAIRAIDTPYVFTLDTDTETIAGGFLQQMVNLMKGNDNLYAIGWLRWVDKFSGVPLEWHIEKQPPERFIAYIHPSSGLYRVSMYHTLAPFFHHGAPCLDNMREASRRELLVSSFPIHDYVKHLKAGTRRMYDGQWDPTSKSLRKEWRAKDDFPI